MHAHRNRTSIWWPYKMKMCSSLSWTLRSSCVVWTTLSNTDRSVSDTSGREVASSFLLPDVWEAGMFAHVQDHTQASLPFPVWFSFLVRARSWQTFIYQSPAFGQENTEENSVKLKIHVLHLCRMLWAPPRDSDSHLWEFLCLQFLFLSHFELSCLLLRR